jgi:tetratricopeptide (TPR) repeat protein
MQASVDISQTLRLNQIPEWVARAAGDPEGQQSLLRMLTTPERGELPSVRFGKEHLLLAVQTLYGHLPWWWLRRAQFYAESGQDVAAVAASVVALRRGASPDEAVAASAASALALGFEAWIRAQGASSVPIQVSAFMGLRERVADQDFTPGHEDVALLQTLSTHPSRAFAAEALRILGDLRNRAGAPKDALAEWTRSLDLSPNPAFALILAERVLESGQLDLAEVLLTASEEGGVFRETRLLWADLARRRGQVNEAFAVFERALATAPVPASTDGRAAFQAVRRQVQAWGEGDPARWKSLHPLRQAAQVKRPNPARRRDTLAQLRLRGARLACSLGQPAAAVRMFKPLAAQRAGWQVAVPEIVASLLLADRPAEAEDLLVGLETRRGRKPLLTSLLGMVQHHRGEVAGAQASFLMAYGNEDSLALSHLGLALAQGDAGDLPAAWQFMNMLPANLREDPAVLELAAGLLGREGRPEGALALWRTIHERYPSVERWFQFGRLLARQGAVTSDKELLRQAVEVLGTLETPVARLHLALAQLKLGQPVDEGDIPLVTATDAQGSEDDVSVMGVVLEESVRARVLSGRLQDAADLLRSVPVPVTPGLKERVLAAAACRDLEAALRQRVSPADLLPLRQTFESFGRAPLTVAVLELLGALGVGPADHVVREEVLAQVPHGLRLAMAVAYLSEGRHLDRIRALLPLPTGPEERALPECRVLLQVLEPDGHPGTLEADLMHCRDAVFPWLLPEVARAVDLRRLALAGLLTDVQADPEDLLHQPLLRLVAGYIRTGHLLRLLQNEGSRSECAKASAELRASLFPDHPLADTLLRLETRTDESGADLVIESGSVEDVPLSSIDSVQHGPPSEAAASDPLTDARKLIAQGFLEDAEFVLDAAFARAVQAGSTTQAREVVQLLLLARDSRDGLRDELRIKACEAWLSERKAQRVLDATGGGNPESNLKLELRHFRVLACYLQNDERTAEDEHHRFLSWSSLEALGFGLHWSATDARFFAMGIVAHGRLWLDLLALLRRGQETELLERLRPRLHEPATSSYERLLLTFLGEPHVAATEAVALAEEAAHEALSAGDEGLAFCARDRLRRLRSHLIPSYAPPSS